MNILSHNIFEEMDRMRREIDRVLDEARFPAWTSPFSRFSFLPGRSSLTYPLINVGEDNDNIYVDALAPGVDPHTLNISVSGNRLVISGEKTPLPERVNPDSIHRSERSAGRFARSLSLQREVDKNRADAVYQNGVLKITIPKSEMARPRQVPVNVG